VRKPLGRREMRRFDRRRASFAVTVRAAGGKVDGMIHLTSADLSEGGAFLCSELLFEVGDPLELEIALPSGSPIKASSRVVRVSRDTSGETPPGMGVEFTQLAPGDRRALVAALIRAGATAAKPAAGAPGIAPPATPTPTPAAPVAGAAPAVVAPPGGTPPGGTKPDGSPP
jgi:hypothetical protein